MDTDVVVLAWARTVVGVAADGGCCSDTLDSVHILAMVVVGLRAWIQVVCVGADHDLLASLGSPSLALGTDAAFAGAPEPGIRNLVGQPAFCTQSFGPTCTGGLADGLGFGRFIAGQFAESGACVALVGCGIAGGHRHGSVVSFASLAALARWCGAAGGDVWLHVDADRQRQAVLGAAPHGSRFTADAVGRSTPVPGQPQFETVRVARLAANFSFGPLKSKGRKKATRVGGFLLGQGRSP